MDTHVDSNTNQVSLFVPSTSIPFRPWLPGAGRLGHPNLSLFRYQEAIRSHLPDSALQLINSTQNGTGRHGAQAYRVAWPMESHLSQGTFAPPWGTLGMRVAFSPPLPLRGHG